MATKQQIGVCGVSPGQPQKLVTAPGAPPTTTWQGLVPWLPQEFPEQTITQTPEAFL